MGALVERMRYTHHDLELNLSRDTLGVGDDDEHACDDEDDDFVGLGLGNGCLRDRNVLESSLTISGSTSSYGKFVNLEIPWRAVFIAAHLTPKSNMG